MTNNNKYSSIKVGDIISRTTIPDRIVFMKDSIKYTVNLNNGKIEQASIRDFDIITGNVYENTRR